MRNVTVVNLSSTRLQYGNKEKKKETKQNTNNKHCCFVLYIMTHVSVYKNPALA